MHKNKNWRERFYRYRLAREQEVNGIQRSCKNNKRKRNRICQPQIYRLSGFAAASDSADKRVFRDLILGGIGFDGSSIRGFQSIDESDMLLKPDIDTFFVDPFADDPTISFICNVKDPITLQLYSCDPRYIA